MLSCWRINAELRPTFGDLEERIYRLLERNVATRYIDLNEPYMIANLNRFNSGQKDFLKLLFMKVSSSGYVEVNSKPNLESKTKPAPGYVEMRRNDSGINNNSQDSIV